VTRLAPAIFGLAAMLAAAGAAQAQDANQGTASPGAAPAMAAPAGPPSDMLQGDEAVLQGLDKTTARVSKFDAPVDKPVKFGRLIITVRSCYKRPPEDPPETTAFLQIDETQPGAAGTGGGAPAAANRVFSGWMFASSPAISALEDPIYDVNVLDCRIPATSAPQGGSAGK
jgi:hypothetical protein